MKQLFRHSPALRFTMKISGRHRRTTIARIRIVGGLPFAVRSEEAENRVIRHTEGNGVKAFAPSLAKAVVDLRETLHADHVHRDASMRTP